METSSRWDYKTTIQNAVNTTLTAFWFNIFRFKTLFQI